MEKKDKKNVNNNLESEHILDILIKQTENDIKKLEAEIARKEFLLQQQQ